MKKKLSAILASLIVAMIYPVWAQDPPPDNHRHSPGPGINGATPLKLSIPDVDVFDQQGRKRKFYSDLVKDKVVVINFAFTSCKAMCPLLGANFSKLQRELGERLGRDVFLITVSTDPETDTPGRLKAWSEKYNAKAGWTLVTGKKEVVEDLLQVLTGDGPNKGYHLPSMWIVNDSRQTHRKAYGLEAPQEVVRVIDELAKAE